MSYKKSNIVLPPNKNFSPKVSFENQKEYYQTLINNTDIAKAFDFSTPDNFLYTRANLAKEFIQPNKGRLRLISENKGKNISALDFVVDAYEDFRTFFKNKKFKKLIDDPIIKKDWGAVQGWSDIDIYYGNRMGEIYQSFARQYVGPSLKEKSLTNFDDFLNIFMNHFYGQLNIPLTKSGFMNSRIVGPHFSGLCLKISDADVVGYSNKYNNFVNSKNFEVFSLAAAQFGFMVDYNVPWRLIANLNSPKIAPYIKDRINIVQLNSETKQTFGNSIPHQHSYNIGADLNGFTSPPLDDGVPYHVHEIIAGETIQAQYYSEDAPNTNHIHNLTYDDNHSPTLSEIYGTYFYKTSSVDIETLKIYLVDMYNTYVDNFSVSLFKEICQQSHGYVGISGAPSQRTTQINRKRIDLEEVNSEYNEPFWYKLYFKIRLREVNAQVTDEQASHAIRKMEEYYFSVDNERALRYINDYLKQFY